MQMHRKAKVAKHVGVIYRWLLLPDCTVARKLASPEHCEHRLGAGVVARVIPTRANYVLQVAITAHP